VTVILSTRTTGSATSDPFAFFAPTVDLTRKERATLQAGEPVSRALPAASGEVTIFAAVPVTISGDRLVAWMRNVAELKKSAYVLAIHRFSEPPVLDDLAALSLEEADLQALRRCRPGDCDVKLDPDEIVQVQAAAREGGDSWKAAVQGAFHRILLQRVTQYLQAGQAGEREERFEAILSHSPFLSERVPRFAEYLARYPHGPHDGVESFMYWSQERLAARSIVSLSHVSMVRPAGEGLPDALVAGRQIYVTRYVTSSLGLTAIVGNDPSSRYLVYLNRSAVDVVGGLFGGIVRWFVERRLKAEASEVLTGLRRRLESGPPPAMPSTTRLPLR
jgi:hypothetical protein